MTDNPLEGVSLEELDQLALFEIDDSWIIDELGLDQDAPHGVNTDEDKEGTYA